MADLNAAQFSIFWRMPDIQVCCRNISDALLLGILLIFDLALPLQRRYKILDCFYSEAYARNVKSSRYVGDHFCAERMYFHNHWHKRSQSRFTTLLHKRGSNASRVVLISIFLVVVSYFKPRLASSTTRRTTSLVVSPKAFASCWSHSSWGLLKVTDCLAMWSTLAPLWGLVKCP